jgi:methionyl-tRNA formyltransferase
MKILLLSPYNKPDIIKFLESFGDDVTQSAERLTEPPDADFIISYGYRHILKKSILDKLKNEPINLHISYLPWNRGADPNLWSFIDGTPKGVTIHFIDDGIDTGDIIAQRYLVPDRDVDTFRSFYGKLQACIEDLLYKTWGYIRGGRAKRYPQTTCHTVDDKEPYAPLLELGWDTPIRDFKRLLKNKEK